MSGSAPVAVVTGGATGLGEQIPRRLHSGGHRVAIADLDEAAAKRLATELDRSGAHAESYRVDVANRPDIEQLPASVLGDFGSVEPGRCWSDLSRRHAAPRLVHLQRASRRAGDVEPPGGRLVTQSLVLASRSHQTSRQGRPVQRALRKPLSQP
ncbi:SDR family NAD(P)-dependent oxidoreductase [Amycolatopsis sp. cmx-4-54]|uniref:SDR family NAD(P)-dependent oxidoreductase n=1 Tax=Amycolatopsis sp. cmx-4-54 TaxID=2790936 RepID=UPI003978318C